MIIVSSFITGTLNTVDSVISNYVNTAYTNFVQANSGVITLLFTVYVMMMGYQFLFHRHHEHLSGVIKQIITMLCVYGLVMNWNLYHLFVYQIFTEEPTKIANVLINSTNGMQTGSISEALDGIYLAVINSSTDLFNQINFSASGLAFILYGCFVFVIGTLLCIYTLLLFIYAKLMMAVALALGPIFILFTMWESTRGLFSAWLNKLMTLALIPVVTSGVLALMLSVINVTLPSLTQPVSAMQFHGLAPFLGLCLATTLILSQVLGVCSSLGGGIVIASLSRGASMASSALKYSGVAAASQAIAKGVMSKMRSKPPKPASKPQFNRWDLL